MASLAPLDAPAQWKTHEELPLTRENFEALCNFEIPCLRIKGFATDEECDDLVAAMDAVGLHRSYDLPNLKQPPRYVGVTQFEFRQKTKEEYFAAVEEAWSEREAVLGKMSWDPFERFNGLILDMYPESSLTLAEEPDFGRYYAGIIRETTGGGTLHADVTWYGAPDYAISQIETQITWNLFATAVADGGITTLHNRPYRQEIPAGGRVELEGFDRTYVEGVETHRYTPAKGDVVLFNSHNPHEWTEVASDDRRMGVSTYLGRKADGNFLIWS